MKRLLLLYFIGILTPVFSQIYSRVGDYSEGLALVSGYTSVNGYSKKYGYVNEYNQLVIPLTYEYAESFRKGNAIVGMGIKMGVINKHNKIVLPIKYDVIRFDNDAKSYYISVNGKEGIAGMDGRIIIPLKYDWITFRKEWDVYEVTENDKVGIASKNGRILVPCKYKRIEQETGIVKDGTPFFVAWQGKGDESNLGDLYDTQGVSLLPNGYCLPRGAVRKNGFCVVEKDYKFGVFNLVARRMVLEAEYEHIVIYDDCFLTVKDGLYGLAKTDGTEIYPNSYKSIMGNKCFYVYNEKDEFAVYDAKKQEEVLPFGCKKVEDKIINYKNQYLLWDFQYSCKYDDDWYDTAFVVSMTRGTNGAVEEFGYVLKRNGKFGLKAMKEINNKNILEEVLPFEYDAMEYEDDFHVSWERSVDWWSNKAEIIPVIHIKKDGNWGLFYDNKPTRTVSDAKMLESGHFLIAQRNGKYGFYRPNEDIQFKYDSKPTSFGIDQWLVESKGKYGLVKYYNTQSGGGLSAFGEYIGIVTSPSGIFVECLSPVYDAIRTIGGITLTTKDRKNGFVRITYPQEGQTPVELPYQEVRYMGVCRVEKSPSLFDETINKKYIPCEAFSVVKNGKKKYIGICGDNSVVSITEPKRYEASSGFHAKLADSHWMLMANYGLSNVMQHSFGATLAWTNHFGGYVSVMTNGRMGIETDLITTLDDPDDYFWTGEISTARLSVTAGALLPVTEASYVYVGAGYGKRDLVWHTMSGQSVAMTPGTFSDVALEGGLLLGLGRHGLLSIGGLVQLPSSYLEAKIGLGYKF